MLDFLEMLGYNRKSLIENAKRVDDKLLLFDQVDNSPGTKMNDRCIHAEIAFEITIPASSDKIIGEIKSAALDHERPEKVCDIRLSYDLDTSLPIPSKEKITDFLSENARMIKVLNKFPIFHAARKETILAIER